MALHEVQLKGYSVRPSNLSLGTFDSYGIEQLHITLDDTWSGLAVTATFNPPEGEPVEIRVPENGLIDVPAEATANEGTGTIVYCGVANGVQRISKTQGYSVITHGNVGTTVAFNPSESLATQVLQAALSAEQSSAEAKSVADGLRTDAANGKFNGKDGAKGDKGDTGTTPQLKIGEDNLWHVSYDNGATWVSLGVKATGDTGAAGKDGVNGQTPRIGDNGNWWIGDTDTGVLAKGKKGDTGAKGADGVSPTVQVETIDGGHRVTLTDASGAHAVDVLDGKPGKDAVVDATLTQDGQAADAKVTGEKIGQLKEDTAKLKDGKISKFYASSQGNTNLPDSDDGRIMDLKLYGKSSQDGTPTPDAPVEIKSVVNPVVTISDGADKQQTVTLPYTLNAIPVTRGGNVTIAGQQYIADYVDIERGKLIQKNFKYKITGNENIYAHFSGWIYVDTGLKIINEIGLSNVATLLTDPSVLRGQFIRFGSSGVYFTYNDTFTDVDTFKAYVKNTDVYIIAALQEPIETDLTADEIAAFKALARHYPATNVSTTSDQLDGYTVFDYPISLANGWNYVKQQLGDTRDYLYGIDLMTAEAYVNSEYAAALAEIEV